MRAASLVPHWRDASPFSSITSWSSQHMQSIMSASRARSTTESHGSVSPVNTMLPSGLSSL